MTDLLRTNFLSGIHFPSGQEIVLGRSMSHTEILIVSVSIEGTTCLRTPGCSLAAAEIRLVLAKMLWNFDMSLHPNTKKDWFNQKVFTLWEKPPLHIELKPVIRE